MPLTCRSQNRCCCNIFLRAIRRGGGAHPVCAAGIYCEVGKWEKAGKLPSGVTHKEYVHFVSKELKAHAALEKLKFGIYRLREPHDQMAGQSADDQPARPPASDESVPSWTWAAAGAGAGGSDLHPPLPPPPSASLLPALHLLTAEGAVGLPPYLLPSTPAPETTAPAAPYAAAPPPPPLPSAHTRPAAIHADIVPPPHFPRLNGQLLGWFRDSQYLRSELEHWAQYVRERPKQRMQLGDLRQEFTAREAPHQAGGYWVGATLMSGEEWRNSFFKILVLDARLAFEGVSVRWVGAGAAAVQTGAPAPPPIASTSHAASGKKLSKFARLKAEPPLKKGFVATAAAATPGGYTAGAQTPQPAVLPALTSMAVEALPEVAATYEELSRLKGGAPSSEDGGSDSEGSSSGGGDAVLSKIALRYRPSDGGGGGSNSADESDDGSACGVSSSQRPLQQQLQQQEASLPSLSDYFFQAGKSSAGLHERGIVVADAAGSARFKEAALLGRLVPTPASGAGGACADADDAAQQVFLNTHEPFCVVAVGVQGAGAGRTVRRPSVYICPLSGEQRSACNGD